MVDSNGLFKTSDTGIATYLVTEGFTIYEIDYSQPRYYYVFNESVEKLREYEHKYISGRAIVDPSVFIRINKKLLRVIKNELQWWDD